jgi:hypothetical protein
MVIRLTEVLSAQSTTGTTGFLQMIGIKQPLSSTHRPSQ